MGRSLIRDFKDVMSLQKPKPPNGEAARKRNLAARKKKAASKKKAVKKARRTKINKTKGRK